jgi:hypothetical protein
MSLREAGKQLGVNKDTVRADVYGKPTKPSGKQTPEPSNYPPISDEELAHHEALFDRRLKRLSDGGKRHAPSTVSDRAFAIGVRTWLMPLARSQRPAWRMPWGRRSSVHICAAMRWSGAARSWKHGRPTACPWASPNVVPIRA